MRIRIVMLFNLIILLVFCSLLLSFHNSYSPNKGKFLPLCFSYLNSQPPDSIKEIIETTFRENKIKVIEWKTVMDMYQAQAKLQLSQLISSGDLNEKTAKNFGKDIFPVSNILAITIFRDSTENEGYTIDSIGWVVSSMPAKVKPKENPPFIPDSSGQHNINGILKEFSEKVILSGLLK